MEVINWDAVRSYRRNQFSAFASTERRHVLTYLPLSPLQSVNWKFVTDWIVVIHTSRFVASYSQ